MDAGRGRRANPSFFDDACLDVSQGKAGADILDGDGSAKLLCLALPKLRMLIKFIAVLVQLTFGDD